MLQQILRDLRVDPDILAELDDQQKQTLFCKMREEQVRRWSAWTEKLGADPAPIRPAAKAKSVRFLQGEDGAPWVWVMGEHRNDKSIEQILKEEAMDKARRIAEKEAEELRRCYEAQLNDYAFMSPKIEPPPNDVDIYCSVDELREKINNKVAAEPLNNANYFYSSSQQNKMNKFNVIDTRNMREEMKLKSQQKVAQRVALWEQRLTEERTCEILIKLQNKREENAREAEEAANKQDQLWQEQERKAKHAEQQIREIARRARQEHKLANFEIDTAYSTVTTTGIPPGRAAVIDWYKDGEKTKKAGLDASNNIEPWFHGLITRSEAEKLLQDQAYGSFLVRLSERVWGYAISYKGREKCKHFLVSATIAEGKYQFLGNNQIEHNTLGDLIGYHQVNPLTDGEKLIEACPRGTNSAISELFESN